MKKLLGFILVVAAVAAVAYAVRRHHEPLAKKVAHERSLASTHSKGDSDERIALSVACGVAACDGFTRNDCMDLVVGNDPTDEEVEAGLEILASSITCLDRACGERAACISGD
ncbi:MAG TPA: hypothetical protein VGM90_02250 [Kofleriaceae bacterium]|jgi:hypothetical protein